MCGGTGTSGGPGAKRDRPTDANANAQPSGAIEVEAAKALSSEVAGLLGGALGGGGVKLTRQARLEHEKFLREAYWCVWAIECGIRSRGRVLFAISKSLHLICLRALCSTNSGSGSGGGRASQRRR